MGKRLRIVWLGLLLPLGAQSEVTLGTLLQEMSDHGTLAEFPDPEYRLLSASSRDRGSILRNGPGWYANNDWSNFVRVETIGTRKESVLMDAAKPGAIVRFWAAPPDPNGIMPGTIRIYFDGAVVPSLEMPIEKFLNGGLAGSPLSEVTAKGRNSYLPIPYARACKVTVENGGANIWYVINYREYGDGAKVRTFSAQDLAGAEERLGLAQRALGNPEVTMAGDARGYGGPAKILTASGASLTVDIPGPGAVCKLVLKVRGSDPGDALRNTRLRLAFDGEITVGDVPIGDFFASGAGLNATRGWYSQVGTDGTLTSYWEMPFRKNCRLELRYMGTGQADLTVADLRVRSREWNPERTMYFHARWKGEASIPATAQSGVDWSYLLLPAGKGVYAGDVLSVVNRADSWWGEGDEKVFVDGESFPSGFGTGSEDYYGYAYGDPVVFASAFHGQPLAKANGTAGPTVDWRMRDLDGIPFRKSLEFNLEIWNWATTRMDYAVANFWYAFPDTLFRFQAEELDAGADGGLLQVQRTWEFPWSAGAQRWWTDPAPGDSLEFRFLAPADGFYSVSGRFTEAPDYGRFDLRLDGMPLRIGADFYSPTLRFPDATDLGKANLGAGAHTLTVLARGANPAAAKGSMFGMDYLELRRESPTVAGRKPVKAAAARDRAAPRDALGRRMRATLMPPRASAILNRELP